MENFCSQPWIGLDISPFGGIKPCCKFRDDWAKGFWEYQKSDLLSDVRKSFLNDERHPGCIRCWKDEDAGILSKRLMDGRTNLSDIDEDVLKTVSLTFGNICNLACRTCGTHSSSRWMQEVKTHGDYRNDAEAGLIFTHDKFYKDLSLWEEIAKRLTNGAHIDISGGEIFLSDIEEHAYFLSLLEGKTDKTTIHYTTNGTFFPDETIIERWTKFKSVQIQVSIDGTDKMFEYTRWPGKWEVFYNNIKRYKQLVKDHTHIQLSLSHTVSVMNVLNLPQFLYWCMKEQLPFPYLGMVYQPTEFSIRCLPRPIKQEITAKLERYGNKLSSILTYMNNEDLPPVYFQSFLTRTEFLDKCRNQRFEDYCPELYDLIKKAA